MKLAKSKRACKHVRFRNRVRRHDWASWDYKTNHPGRNRRLGDLYDNDKWR